MGSITEPAYHIEGTLRQLPLEAYMPEYFDPERFLALCEHCTTYLTNWSCPPFAFDVREVLAHYHYAHILVHRVTPDEQSWVACQPAEVGEYLTMVSALLSVEPVPERDFERLEVRS